MVLARCGDKSWRFFLSCFMFHSVSVLDIPLNFSSLLCNDKTSNHIVNSKRLSICRFGWIHFGSSLHTRSNVFELCKIETVYAIECVFVKIKFYLNKYDDKACWVQSITKGKTFRWFDVRDKEISCQNVISICGLDEYKRKRKSSTFSVKV